MSSDDARLDTERLLELAVPTHVDNLTRWDGDPWQSDVGSAAAHSSRLGQTRLVLTHGGMVVYGGAVVDAQRHQPDDGGMVPAVDLAAAGFSLVEAQAAALSMMTADRAALIDRPLLAELTIGLHEAGGGLLEAAGWDGDDIDGVLADIERDDDEADDPIGGPAKDVRCPDCGSVFAPEGAR